MDKKNAKIRIEATNKGVFHWEIADRIGVTDTTFSRWLRYDLPEYKEKAILAAIEEIYSERGPAPVPACVDVTQTVASSAPSKTVASYAPSKLAFSIAEAAKALGISRPTMHKLMQSDGFPYIQIGGRKLIPIVGLEEWIETNAERRPT